MYVITLNNVKNNQFWLASVCCQPHTEVAECSGYYYFGKYYDGFFDNQEPCNLWCWQSSLWRFGFWGLQELGHLTAVSINARSPFFSPNSSLATVFLKPCFIKIRVLISKRRITIQVNTEPTISRSIKLIVRPGADGGMRPPEKVSGDYLILRQDHFK